MELRRKRAKVHTLREEEGERCERERERAQVHPGERRGWGREWGTVCM